MTVHIAQAILLAAATYLIAGLGFGVAFLALGLERVDHAGKGAPLSFRLLILPGVAALWPLLLKKWIASSREGAS